MSAYFSRAIWLASHAWVNEFFMVIPGNHLCLSSKLKLGTNSFGEKLECLLKIGVRKPSVSVHVSRSSLQTTQHPSADGCGVVVHATCACLTARTLVVSWIDLRGYRAVSAHFPAITQSGSPLDVARSDVTPPSCNFPPSQGYKMPPNLRSSSVFGLTPI